MYTTDTLPTNFCIAQAIGLSGTAWLSGNIFSLSLMTVPALLQSHKEHKIPLSTITKQWALVYETGKNRAPPIALFTAATLLYLSWATRSESTLAAIAPRGATTTYAISAALTIAIVPWTILAMKGTNDALMEKAKMGVQEEKNPQEGERVLGLLNRWALLNGARAVWPLAGFLVGLSAVVP
ncbi:hypothetical protein BDQ94DRAFT_133468 [Aspergillus welwitschiae]|uniref:DUF1772-domain-containing protein n=1 Tax=Aspergillus welwitschiae TaxID=1341132 RepID=A0A3F3QKE6_9EURO|nr:hypothetical protein BDQ94DRAFT_133468 [Aspergillus welwitschiae]RDH39661.1 hypothetical protein BDQ94DRAFT_133468 [Aspergillus welwitschiae]